MSLRQFHLPVNLTTHLCKSHLNGILPLHSQSSNWLFSKRYSYNNSACTPVSPTLATWLAHHSLTDYITLTIEGNINKSLSSSLHNILNCLHTSSFLGSNILFSYIYNLHHTHKYEIIFHTKLAKLLSCTS